MGKLLTFAQAAERAANSPAWWRKLASRRGIAVVKLGRSARLREEDVERIIRDGYQPTHGRAQNSGQSGSAPLVVAAAKPARGRGEPMVDASSTPRVYVRPRARI